METENKCMDCRIDRKDMLDIPWSRGNNRIQCNPCKEKEVENKIKLFQESETDTEFEDEIICPNCGNKHEQDGESEVFYNGGEHDFECGYCNEIFKVNTDISFIYSTYKI